MADQTKEKKSIFNKIKDFFVDYKHEIKKIIWPTPKMTFKNTGIVLVMILIVGVFVFLLDAGLMQLLGMIMSVSKY